jgi:hypothetical protein
MKRNWVAVKAMKLLACRFQTQIEYDLTIVPDLISVAKYYNAGKKSIKNE